jgi:signal transduction histidine kinase
VLTVILITSGAVVYLTSRSVILARVDDDLQERAREDPFLVSHRSRGGGPGGGGPEAKSEFDPGGYYFAFVDEDGEILEGSPYLDTQALASQSTLARALKDGEAFTDTESSNGDSQRMYVLAVDTTDGGQALLQIGRSIEPEDSALSQLRTILMAVVAISVVPAVAGGYLLSGRALRPIKAAMDSQRAFIADASHELRTPVAVVRTNAEILQRHLEAGTIGRASGDETAVQDILSESDRLGRMVGQMLTLAEADVGEDRTSVTEVSISQVAEEVGRSMKALAGTRGLSLQTQIEEDLNVRGDRDRLRELLVVLLDNAVKYTNGGGRVELAARRDQKKAVITVSDTGRGIPAESLPHLFDRFYRVDKARARESGGAGLGLAIARHIVDAHGGSINIESAIGQGTKVTVELPA